MNIVTPRRPKDLVNITPLIDVVFILLVFFMLAGAIERPEEIEVVPPASESDDSSDIEDVSILIGADGSVAFMGVRMGSDEELVRTATVWFARRPDSSIQLKADSEADAVRVIEVMERLREAGAQYLVLITVSGGPQPEDGL
jgi:biopolymer transport protein ExbD